MPRLKVTFSDGSTEIFHSEQTFHLYDENNMRIDTNSLYADETDSMIQSFEDIIRNSYKFIDDENSTAIYYSSEVKSAKDL